MEFFQQLISMGPDGKDIINISAPHLWFPGGGLQSPCLKAFHKDIGYDWREGITHCCSFYLLDWADYVAKKENLLKDSAYKEVKRNPTPL